MEAVGKCASLPREANVLLGRDEERTLLESALVPGGTALVLGRSGTGKTALLHVLRDAAAAEGFVVGLAQVSEDTHVTLRRVLRALGDGEGARLRTVRGLQARLAQFREEHRTALLLDDADRANAGLLRWLRRLVLEGNACVIVAGRTGPADPPERLRRTVYAGSREVRLGPLPPGVARALATRELGPDGDGDLTTVIARESRGLPAAIVEMCRRRLEPRYRFGDKVSWALLLADLRLENRI